MTTAAGRWRLGLRLTALAALAACLAGLVWRLSLFLGGAATAVRYPAELDYGEGIVWEQMREILAGRGYAPIDGFPTIVFHYTPLYHLVTGITARAGGFDALATGRAVSIAATLVSAVLVGLLTARLAAADNRAVRIICGVVASLIALSCLPVAQWGVLMRVDMVAYAFALTGLYLAMNALDRPQLIHGAALAFVAALFTKQNLIAAPAATFGVLLLFRPRLAIAGLATCVGVGLATLAALTIATHGEFLRHVFVYNVNRFDLSAGWRVIKTAWKQHWVFGALALFGALAMAWRSASAFRGGRACVAPATKLRAADHTRALVALAYLAIVQALTLLTGKSGSSYNYMIEAMLAVSIFAGLSLAPTARLAFASHPVPTLRTLGVGALAVLTPLALVFQVSELRRPRLERRVVTAVQTAQYAQLSAMVRDARQPVISDDMVLLLKNGKPVVWEPAIFAELASMGLYDEHQILRMMRAHAFAFFVTDGDRGGFLFDQRYNPPVADALARAYPCKTRLARLVVHRPAEACAQAFTSRQY